MNCEETKTNAALIANLLAAKRIRKSMKRNWMKQKGGQTLRRNHVHGLVSMHAIGTTVDTVFVANLPAAK